MKSYTWERIKKDSIIKQFFDRYKLSEKYLDGFYNKHVGEHGETPGEFLMSVFKIALESVSYKCKTEKEKDENLNLIYFSICYFQRSFENKQSNDFWKLASIYKLKNQLNQSGQFEKEVIMIANKCCPECSKNDEKILTVYDAINNSPISPKKCSRKVGCVCLYGIKGKRNKNGRLIYKSE